jgi:exodeoxyribonuclease V alpha subunit
VPRAVAEETLRGRVKRLFFASPTFTAGELRKPDGEVARFAGPLMVQRDDDVVLVGRWELHPRFGLQFQVTRFTFDLPVTADGLAHYLANHPECKGIGPARAKRIALAFGDRLDEAIEREPERVAAVGQLSLDAVRAVREAWRATRELNAAMTWLASFGLTHHQVTTLIDRLGNSVVAALRADPYLLVHEVPGFGFKRVDQIAQKLGTPKDHPSRLRAGLLHGVADRVANGDCWVDERVLVEQANRLLVLDTLDSRARIEAALDEAIDAGALACVSIGGRFLVAQPALYSMERDIARWLVARANPHRQRLADSDVGSFGLPLNEGTIA